MAHRDGGGALPAGPALVDAQAPNMAEQERVHRVALEALCGAGRGQAAPFCEGALAGQGDQEDRCEDQETTIASAEGQRRCAHSARRQRRSGERAAHPPERPAVATRAGLLRSSQAAPQAAHQPPLHADGQRACVRHAVRRAPHAYAWLHGYRPARLHVGERGARRVPRRPQVGR